jgi:hypothetical protein
VEEKHADDLANLLAGIVGSNAASVPVSRDER